MLVLESKNLLCRLWKLLLDTLVWSGLVEVQDIGLEEAVELFLVQDQEMIQAFSPHAPSKAFTDGIRLWRSIRSSKHLVATRAKFWPHFLSLSRIRYVGVCPYGAASRSGTRNPRIGRRSCHIHMNDLARRATR
jgi:hypothetical protein